MLSQSALALFWSVLLLALSARAAERKVVAYVPNWIDLQSFAKGINYAKLTHINIAFENPANDAGDLSFSAQNQALIERAHAAQVKVLVSIGGGAASGDEALKKRYRALCTEPQRAAFVAKLVAYLVQHQLDGLDVDIEGPAIDANYGALVHDLATALLPQGKLLTAALSKGYGGNKVPDAALGEFSFVNIMAYDGAGPWDPKAPGQHSSLQFARENVEYWLQRGLPKEKAVLGVPFYGYGFNQAFRQRDYPYAEIVRTFPGAEQTDQAGDTIWYNGLPTIQAKANYVVNQGLGGMMIWSLDYDVPGEKSLLTAMHTALAR